MKEKPKTTLSPKKKVKNTKVKTATRAVGKKNKKAGKLVLVGSTLVMLALFVFLGRSASGVDEVFLSSAEIKDISSSILLSGKVVSDDTADLAFGKGGRVSEFRVSEGEVVSSGQILARLDVSDIAAEIQQAIATQNQVKAEKNEVLRGSSKQTSQKFSLAKKSAGDFLKEVIDQQEILVENARKILLTSSLEAISVDLEENATSPNVTGFLSNFTEGDIGIEVYASSASSGSSVRFTGLVSGTQTLSFSQPVPLGNSGLFLSFGEDSRYSGTDWVISIPNSRGSLYSTNLAAYNSALKAKSVAISSANQSLVSANSEKEIDLAGSTDESISAVNARLSAAQSQVQVLRARRENYTITAPFDGVISSISKSVGETVSAGEMVVSMLKDKKLSVEVDIPELDIGLVSLGSLVSVELDAYKGNIFEGTLTEIQPAESLRDGVVVYKATVDIIEDDSLVLSGMTARATILIKEKNNTVALPKYFTQKIRVEKADFTCIAIQEKGGEVGFAKIETGITGSDGYVEVVSGITPTSAIIDPEYFEEKRTTLEKECKEFFEII